MEQSKNLKRVSGASGANLCQVKYFWTVDSPSQAHIKCQDHHFQAKESLQTSHSSWRTPPKIAISSYWQVAAGEESTEEMAQKLREERVPEAIYPQFSNIPPIPIVSLYVEEEHYDDRQTPLVRTIPIEDDEDQSSMIDIGLSNEVFGDPKIVGKSMDQTGAIADIAPALMVDSNSISGASGMKTTEKFFDHDYIPHITQPRSKAVTSSSSPIPSNPFAAVNAKRPVNDLRYSRILIREFGEHKPGNPDRSFPKSDSYRGRTHEYKRTVRGSTMASSRTKFKIACKFFASRKGCRNGSRCRFQHDSSVQREDGDILEAPKEKKMKLNGSVNGRRTNKQVVDEEESSSPPPGFESRVHLYTR